jgi:hypothetical protein
MPNVLSWRTDCLTFEQLAPNFFRPGAFRNYPFPRLLRLEIFGPVFDWFEERPSLFQTVCLTLRTAYASHWRRFFAIDDRGREGAGGYPWERLCEHPEWHRDFELSIRVSMDKGTVHTILEPDGYGGLIEETSAHFWDGDNVLKFWDGWSEGSDLDHDE